MGLPSKLKNMNLFIDGENYVGMIPEVSIPKLGRKMEGYRAGGLDAELMIDMGGEPIEFEWTAGGVIEQVYGQFGLPTIDGAQLRWAGAYQDDSSAQWKSVEITVRGRHQEIDPGTGKPGEDTAEKIKTVCAYYRLTIDGRDVIEIDVLNMVFAVNGVDRHAEMRAILGI